VWCPPSEAQSSTHPGKRRYRRFALRQQPVLTIDRTENPPALNPYFGTVADLPGRIFVVQVLSRMEKTFAFDLFEREVPYYLPLAQLERFSGRKRYYVTQPLFSHYVFVASPEDTDDSLAETMTRCKQTRRVCQTIPAKNQTRIRADLINLELALAKCPRMEQCPLVKGQQVRIVEGPLRNLEGVILEREHSAVLVLRVGDMCASVEIPRVMVEPV
jgi:transcription antitermination factor NusG